MPGLPWCRVSDRQALGLVLAAVILLAAFGARSPAYRDHRLPRSACTQWMADAVPGIGPKTSAAIAEAIRRGNDEALPPVARATVGRLFQEP